MSRTETVYQREAVQPLRPAVTPEQEVQAQLNARQKKIQASIKDASKALTSLNNILKRPLKYGQQTRDWNSRLNEAYVGVVVTHNELKRLMQEFANDFLE